MYARLLKQSDNQSLTNDSLKLMASPNLIALHKTIYSFVKCSYYDENLKV